MLLVAALLFPVRRSHAPWGGRDMGTAPRALDPAGAVGHHPRPDDTHPARDVRTDRGSVYSLQVNHASRSLSAVVRSSDPSRASNTRSRHPKIKPPGP